MSGSHASIQPWEAKFAPFTGARAGAVPVDEMHAVEAALRLHLSLD
jgi:hypothetical protein